MTTHEITEQLKQALEDSQKIKEVYVEQLTEAMIEIEALKETVNLLQKETLRKIAREKRSR